MATPKKLASSDYVHLHNHTQYSLLDGLTKVPALIEYVAESGMQAVAMTDHGTLSGTVEFYKEAKAKGIKPIIGMEAYVAARSHTDKEPQKDKVYYHLIILAMNYTGYQNLMQLSTIANLQGFYYKPRIDHDLLEKYNEGLIILSGCIGGEVGDAIRQGQYKKAQEVASWYKKIFGDRYYLEIQDHGHNDHQSKWDEQVVVNEGIIKLSKEHDIPLVVTCDAHYLQHDDQEAHEILLCVQTGSFLSDENRMSLKNFELHVTDPNEIISRWGKDYPEAITNTRAIADRCNVELDLGKILIPKFPLPKGENEKDSLHKLVYQGLAWRYGDKSEPEAEKLTNAECKKTLPKEVLERAEFELDVIDSMGFNGYFLIIQDFINWGKDSGIVFGPGRGSAAGSIIAFALKITELDPLKYDLLFERFLNPDRISMPDIDIDIQDSRRDEVIQYCVQKYGTDRVANIVTFGRMAARNAVRDVARVLQVPYAEADRLAKMIPPPLQGNHIPLAVSIVKDADLKHEYESSPETKRLFDLAVRLEGTIRSHGVHAAGVVIAPDDIVKFAPLEMAQKGVVATQYSMGPIEELGLLKMDFLGLSNLTTIKNALRIVKKVYKKDIDITTIPLDDKKAYELLQRGDTTGVFQLESAGMKRYLKDLKPTVFEDIVAMVALYRPGPMQFIDDFIARKHGLRDIVYPHPAMENSLKNTYGVLVYQEQVMQISKEVCGFTGGEADTLRKAIGKKKIDIMRKMKKRMIEGGQEVSGIEPELMERFWKQLEDFAAYCFNKSHAACYGLIAYQTAYLKAHYPSAFMAALMTSDYDDTDRLSIEISECQHQGITVLAPDVNESFHEFAVVPKTNDVRFGMDAIKNVGHGAVEEILRARSLEGKFTDVDDFFRKVNVRIVNRKSLESLIKSGAFDGLGQDRNTLLFNLDACLKFASKTQSDATSGQVDLFGAVIGEENTMKPKITFLSPSTALSSREQLMWERELLGLYLSQHPLEQFEIFLAEQTVPIDKLQPAMDGKSVVVGGAVTEKREITTKNGQKMAFVKIADKTAEVEVLLFPSALQATTGIWEKDHVVLIQGRINAKDKDGAMINEVKIIVNEAREVTVEQAMAYQTTGKASKVPKVKATVANTAPGKTEVIETLYVRIVDSQNNEVLFKLKKLIDHFHGNSEVVLVLGPADKKQIIKLPLKVSPTEMCISELRLLVGEENVKVQ